MFGSHAQTGRPLRMRSALLPLVLLAAIGLPLLLPAAARAEPAPAAGAGDAGPEGAGEAANAFRAAADALYAAVVGGNRLEADRSLKAAERAFRALPIAAVPTAEGVEALAGSVAEMKRAWAAVRPDEQRLEQTAGALRLAADALTRPDVPMWLQYKPLLLEDVGELAAGLGGTPNGPSEQAKQALERIRSRYALIRTAALISRDPSTVERADSVLRYADRLMKAERPDPKLLASMAASVRQSLAELFPDKGERQATVPALLPPTWGVAATIGSFIVTVLSWAGWRRYKYDRTHPRR